MSNTADEVAVTSRDSKFAPILLYTRVTFLYVTYAIAREFALLVLLVVIMVTTIKGVPPSGNSAILMP